MRDGDGDGGGDGTGVGGLIGGVQRGSISHEVQHVRPAFQQDEQAAGTRKKPREEECLLVTRTMLSLSLSLCFSLVLVLSVVLLFLPPSLFLSLLSPFSAIVALVFSDYIP